MNYLAHAYLSDGSAESLVGSLLGDFVKGDDHHGYSPAIRQAILLHRRIDIYTDAHPVHRRSKTRLAARYRHTRGILVDIFYDHFLAKDWERYGTGTLEEFTARVYRVLEDHWPILPPRLKSILPHMMSHDWLCSYRNMESVEWALNGLSMRLSRRNVLAHGLEELRQHYTELEGDFREFFPQLIEYAAALRDAD